jgi:predicted O-methyltransferase YrrM
MKNLLSYHVYPFLKLLLLVLCYPVWMALSPYKRRRFLEFSRLAWNDLPAIALDALIPPELQDDVSVSLKALRTQDHNCTLTELFVLAVATKATSARNAYEIGTYDGRSTLAIAANLASGGKIHTLNLPEDYFDKYPGHQHRVDIQLSRKVVSGYRFLRQAEHESIVQVWGNSLEYSAEENGPYDLIFIDGGHGYQEVKHDSGEALRLVNRQSGIILWHDATSYGVGKWLPELRKQTGHVYRVKGTDMALLHFKNGKAVEYAAPV